LTQTYNWRLKPKGHQQQGTAVDRQQHPQQQRRLLQPAGVRLAQ
jgi:hypothetical protein